ncbi:MAG TPA: hypothetical protein VL863_08945 [bacterium]|nr:hypothetical protein [bacterium]
MKIFNQTRCFVAMIAMASALNAGAADKTASSPFLGALSAVTSAELPAKAAALVSQSEAKGRTQATKDIVKAAIGLNPAAATAIVGTIAQTSPDMAATAAATAVSLLPDQAKEIARVAAAAAPTKAGEIVAAVCKLLPKQYKEVAKAVAEVAPGQSKEILTALSTAIPALQIPLAKVISGSANNNPSVEIVLSQVVPSLDVATTPTPITSDSATVSPPTFGPPYQPLPGGNVNIDPGTGTNVPTGGRDYASP